MMGLVHEENTDSEFPTTNGRYNLRIQVNILETLQGFSCHKCKKTDQSLLKLIAHELETHENDWRLQCNNCSVYFQDCNDAALHVKIHSISDFSIYPLEGENQNSDISGCQQEPDEYILEFLEDEFPSVDDTQVKTIEMEREKTPNYQQLERPPAFKCDVCMEVTYSKAEIRRHVMKHFTRSDNPRSERCLEMYGGNGRQEKRTTGHKCPNCSRYFYRKQLYRNHLLKCHKKPKVEFDCVCELCNKNFKNRSFLRRHKMLHTGEKPHSCPICTMKFSRTDVLALHIATHTNSGHISCKDCDAKFKTRVSLTCHRKAMHGLKILRAKSAKEIQKIGSRPRRKYCALCSNAVQGSFASHLIDEHTQQSENGYYLCPYCDYKSLSGDYTARHINLKHVVSYECGDCGEGFGQNFALMQHINKFHTGVRPFQCPGCPKKFFTKFSVMQHKNKHCSSMKSDNLESDFAVLAEREDVHDPSLK